MDERFLQQLKKGALEMLVLELISQKPSYGYELLTRLKDGSGGLFTLKEGTLYPILYRLEDDGLISASWQEGEGRKTPKKIYTATEKGVRVAAHRRSLWVGFSQTVENFYERQTK